MGLTILTTTATVASLLLLAWNPSPEEEIILWSRIYQVDPAIALAVHDVESGNGHEQTRDTLVSKGNYGRFQVRCSTWKKRFGLAHCSELHDRHTNIRIGVRILKIFQTKFARDAGQGCRCSTHSTHHWVAHYNAGTIVPPKGRGERYARLVLARARTIRKALTQDSPRFSLFGHLLSALHSYLDAFKPFYFFASAWPAQQ